MRVLKETFSCEKGDYFFYRTISGRRMTDVEADYLLDKRKTPVCGGFLSARTGKGFNAGYKLSKDHKVELFFD
jgi:DNA topoisomerase-3